MMKLLVVGDPDCGKTSLVVVFADGRFPENYVPKALDNKVANIKVDSEIKELTLWDTPGGEIFDCQREYLCGGTDVILMCFSISHPDSLQNIPDKWNPKMQHFCSGVPIILVGNKKDLRDDPVTRADLVSSEKGKAMAERIGAAAYVECSAKTNEGVHEVLKTAVRVTHKAREKRRRKNTCLLC
ncbi:rho-related GTP-binding protein RhoA-B-like isoform X1 [Pomacea canaliculata]|uniref:rho-related GTP-binding protein RhoA-B-like isoform X1 n=1 Tax=Pomacea canaliculata TaxID=400727 RepID=UPI000D73EF7F|nr:rho-related GTP-binding protein RhoA-B-like isoform X1 [Pomacea canaliculata]